MIFMRSKGETTVLETAPATPPATKALTVGWASFWRRSMMALWFEMVVRDAEMAAAAEAAPAGWGSWWTIVSDDDVDIFFFCSMFLW